MARFAALLGKPADRKQFEELAARINEGFHERFFDPKENRYGNGTQTS